MGDAGVTTELEAVVIIDLRVSFLLFLLLYFYCLLLVSRHSINDNSVAVSSPMTMNNRQ